MSLKVCEAFAVELPNTRYFSFTQQNKSPPANGRTAVPRKDQTQTGDGGKRQKSSAGPVKVAAVLKPIRGKSNILKTQSNTAAGGRAQPGLSRTLPPSACSLGSGVVKEGSLDAPAREEPGECEATESVRTTHPSDDAGEESVEDKKEATGEASQTDAAAEKPKSPSRVRAVKSVHIIKVLHPTPEDAVMSRCSQTGSTAGSTRVACAVGPSIVLVFHSM